MVIQHNMSAMNANRQLGLATGSLAKSTEKLSSGYKINRAADDAAGLSISEKMRKQVRGLDQASENIEDGISLCQVADGALNETIDILQRMRELAVQSANGTNSASDREMIEMEVTQLKQEVDRIAETTKFNDAVYPLNAPITYGEIVTETVGETGSGWTGGLLREKTYTFVNNHVCTYEGKTYQVGDTITIEGLTTNDGEIWIWGAIAWGKGFQNEAWEIGSSSFFDLDLQPLKLADLLFDEQGRVYYDKFGTALYAYYVAGLTTTDPLHFLPLDKGGEASGSKRFMYASDLGTPTTGTQYTSLTTTRYFSISSESTAVHSGASASQANKIQVHTVNATCKGLGIENLSVVNAARRPKIDDSTANAEENTTQAMILLDRAIAKASAYRSQFGAVQNRLEHAQKIDDNTSENTQAAESQIRDTDMAAEMVRYTNQNILTQAGQSMLAQANQSRQSVLSLVA